MAADRGWVEASFVHSRANAEKPTHQIGVQSKSACQVFMGVDELSNATNTKAAASAKSVAKMIPAKRYFKIHLTVVVPTATSLVEWLFPRHVLSACL